MVTDPLAVDGGINRLQVERIAIVAIIHHWVMTDQQIENLKLDL